MGYDNHPETEVTQSDPPLGTFCPILRTHCNGKKRGGGYTRDIWYRWLNTIDDSLSNIYHRLYPFDNFVIMREAFQLRSKLVPYIYTGNFLTYQTGQALLRPLYYEYPESEVKRST